MKDVKVAEEIGQVHSMDEHSFIPFNDVQFLGLLFSLRLPYGKVDG